MIKFRGVAADGRPLIGLGLSFTNLDRLRQDQPILIDGRELGLGDCNITIFAGETEGAMSESLVKAGVLPPDFAEEPRPGQRRVWRSEDGHEARPRCPWAIKFGMTLHTRCQYPEGHAAVAHRGAGLARFQGQVIEWFPGDRREYRTQRMDEHAWEEA